MSTGITSYADLSQIAAFSPGAGGMDGGGAEWIMAIVVFVWIIWFMVWQFKQEDKELKEAVRLYKEVGMERAMATAKGRIATDEEMKAIEVQRAMGSRAGH
jgi:uncharacterized membrane protein